MEKHPTELLGTGNTPVPLQMKAVRASGIAQEHGLQIDGEDILIRAIGPLFLIKRKELGATLTYLASENFAHGVRDSENNVVICTADLRSCVPGGNTVIITDRPDELFYTIFAEFVQQGAFDALQGFTSRSARVEATAVVGPNVFIDDDAYIGHGSVILPNTYIGRGVKVKPNATIGGDGFEPKIVSGRKRVVPHAGGTWLCEGVEIGSSTCIDKSLFGDFTYVGPCTLVDNLIHISHGVIVGEECSIAACSEISGTVELGDGVWIGPNVSTNHLVKIGSHCFIGTASVVVKDLPDYALAYGSPAKAKGWVCKCRTKLNFEEGKATCIKCKTRYEEVSESRIRPLSETNPLDEPIR